MSTYTEQDKWRAENPMVAVIDWVAGKFPGDGREIPTDSERALADKLAARTIARVHTETRFGVYAGTPTNRAFIRAAVKRAIAKRA